MGMKEGDSGRKERVVVIDYISEVSHRLMTFVDTGGEDVCCTCGWVDCVYCSLPATRVRKLAP